MSEKVDPDLVTTGPYRGVRHPIYSGIILAMAGTALAVCRRAATVYRRKALRPSPAVEVTREQIVAHIDTGVGGVNHHAVAHVDADVVDRGR